MTPFPLTLVPTKTPQRSTKAWFIPGANPELWLQELIATGLAIAEFGLYFMPTSMSDLNPNGLFVTLSKPERLADHSWSAIPYGQVSKLFLPTFGRLSPDVEPIEIEAEINDFIAVFHPGIGLVGFEQSDMKGIHDLIAAPTKIDDSPWNRAVSVHSLATPRLISVRPEIQLSVGGVLEQARGNIGEKAKPPRPSQRPQEGQRDSTDSVEEKTRRRGSGGEPGGQSSESDDAGWFKKAVAKGVQWFSEKPGSEKSGKTGWFNKLNDWAEKTLSEKLLKRREDEIQRLLKLLDDNPDEGLRYALPIAGSSVPSGPRGPSRPSSHLPSRTIDYSSTKKGGRGSDLWDLDSSVVERLRKKYLKAAKRELHLGRHRRAAYIFSALLHDHNNAALALLDGKHYLEAAMLYKDQLGQPRQAALCLSQGGFYRDAIELYESIQMFEEAGDLYRRLELEEESKQAYIMAANIHRSNGEYLRAGKILDKKAKQALPALKVFKHAWNQNAQATDCILSEFEIYGRLAMHDEAEKRLREFAETPYPVKRLRLLVAATAQLSQIYPKTELRKLAADKTRVIIGRHLPHSSRVEAKHLIRWLNYTQPKDYLLIRDGHRYQNLSKGTKTRKKATKVRGRFQLKKRFQLPSGHWQKAASDRHNFYVAGLFNRQPKVLRIYENGTILTHIWKTIPIDEESASPLPPSITLACSPFGTLPILLKFSNHPPLQFHRFENIDLVHCSNLIGTPHWLSPRTIAAAYTETGTAWTLLQKGQALTLHCYAVESEKLVASEEVSETLRGSQDPNAEVKRVLGLALESAQENEDGDFVFSSPGQSLPFSQSGPFMESHGEMLFIAHNTKLYSFKHSNAQQQETFDDPIESFVVSPALTKARLVLGFNRGARYIGETENLNKGINFARDMTNPKFAFTKSGLIIAASPKFGRVYQIKGSKIVTKSHFDAPRDPILAVLPGVSKDSFTIVTKNGQVSIYEASESP